MLAVVATHHRTMTGSRRGNGSNKAGPSDVRTAKCAEQSAFNVNILQDMQSAGQPNDLYPVHTVSSSNVDTHVQFSLFVSIFVSASSAFGVGLWDACCGMSGRVRRAISRPLFQVALARGRRDATNPCSF